MYIYILHIVNYITHIVFCYCSLLVHHLRSNVSSCNSVLSILFVHCLPLHVQAHQHIERSLHSTLTRPVTNQNVYVDESRSRWRTHCCIYNRIGTTRSDPSRMYSFCNGRRDTCTMLCKNGFLIDHILICTCSFEFLFRIWVVYSTSIIC